MKATMALLGIGLFLGMMAGCTARVPERAKLPTGDGTLIVEMEGFRNDAGEVLVSLFDSEEGFPDETDSALRNGGGEIRNRRAKVILDRIPYGTYALSVLHDEDRDGRMATGLFGRPLEGHGASNDARRTFAQPKFNDARFVLDGDERTLRVRVEYVRRIGPGG